MRDERMVPDQPAPYNPMLWCPTMQRLRTRGLTVPYSNRLGPAAPARGFPPELTSGLFQGVDKKVLDSFLELAMCTRRLPGELFCNQDEPATSLFVLTTGLVKLCGVTSEGKEVLVSWLRPGDCFGLGALVAYPTSNIWTVCAVEVSEALEWSTLAVKRLNILSFLRENALRIAIGWTGKLQQRLQEIATEMVEQRLGHLVTQLPGLAKNDGILELRGSDEELAQMAGTNLYTVSRVLSRWQRLGYIEKRRGRLLVFRLEELRKIADNSRTVT